MEPDLARADFDGQGKTYEEETTATLRMLTFVMIYSATVVTGLSALAYVVLH